MNCPARCRISPASRSTSPPAAPSLQPWPAATRASFALGYSTQRGYGRNYPFGPGRSASAPGGLAEPEELGFAVPSGEIEVTECEMVNQFVGFRESCRNPPVATAWPSATPSAGVMGMALVDRALRAEEYGRGGGVAGAAGRVRPDALRQRRGRWLRPHLKLPHYVDFQSELELIRKLRRPGVAESAQPTVQEKRA
ncbi:carbon-phosphorus lyase complex subunit PhnI [Pseudomonas aeruginosa]|nr:carbon-phosphorus lyase complex subunit PhnI [Pseudomonas aeruginosa]